jgi:hypothetical protein
VHRLTGKDLHNEETQAGGGEKTQDNPSDGEDSVGSKYYLHTDPIDYENDSWETVRQKCLAQGCCVFSEPFDERPVGLIFCNGLKHKLRGFEKVAADKAYEGKHAAARREICLHA